MNEEEAVQKMRDLQISIETTMRYSRAGRRFPGVFLLVLVGILVSLAVIILSGIYDYVLIYPFPGSIPISASLNTSMGVGIPVFVIWAVLSYVIYVYLKRAFSSYPSGSWDNDLKDGIPGILKIIEKEDWQDMTIQLRKAKQSFFVLSILQFLLSWVLAFIVVVFVYFFMVGVLLSQSVAYPNLYLIGFVAGILVVGLGDRYIRRSYSELWYMDGLIAELRWFYLEFQGSGL